LHSEKENVTRKKRITILKKYSFAISRQAGSRAVHQLGNVTTIA